MVISLDNKKMSTGNKLPYDITKKMAQLSPGLLSLVIRAAAHGEKFMQDFGFAVGEIHAAMKRCDQNSISPVVFKDALEYRVKLIAYTIDHGGTLLTDGKAFDDNTKYALTQLDQAAETCFDKKIDMVAFDYAVEFYIGSICEEMDEMKRNE